MSDWEESMKAETPEFYPIKGGWGARPITGGWAVHGRTREEAAAKFAAAVRKHAEIRARPDPIVDDPRR
jgi:hypothetical protein